MMSPIRGLLIGAGTWGRTTAACLQDMAGFELRGVHDTSARNADRLAKKWRLVSVGDEWSAYDVALIATPNAAHTEIALRALEQGLAVISEKPLAETLEAATHLLNRAQELGRPIKVVYEHRFWSWVPVLHELIASGQVGHIHSVHAHYSTTRALHPSRSDWRWDLDVSPLGVMVQLGTHLVDLLDFLFGPATPATSGIIRTKRGVLHGTAIVRFGREGPLASLTTSYLGPPLFVLAVLGTKGHATLRMDLASWPDFVAVGNTAKLTVDAGSNSTVAFDGTNVLRQAYSNYFQELTHDTTPQPTASEADRLIRVSTVLDHWRSAVAT